jgi:hypothetical protein
MAMTKITFEDLPSTNSPINANNLNTLQDNVETEITAVGNSKLPNTGGTINGNLTVTGNLIKGNQAVLVKETGNWQPSVGVLEGNAPTVTYTVQDGKYQKIGNLVFMYFYIRGKVTTLNNVNNYIIINGLPYNLASNIYNGANVISVGVMNDLTSDASNDLSLLPYTGENYMILRRNFGTTACQLKLTSGSYFEIGGSGWYITTD